MKQYFFDKIDIILEVWCFHNRANWLCNNTKSDNSHFVAKLQMTVMELILLFHCKMKKNTVRIK